MYRYRIKWSEERKFEFHCFINVKPVLIIDYGIKFCIFADILCIHVDFFK